MPALAITDHGTMFGVIDFYNAATQAGVKPIIGVEAYMAARSMQDRDSQLDRKASHLLLLAENQTGYENLLKLSSAAQLDGFYYYPRIDHDFLAAHSEGLICTSGCMAAEIPRAIERGNMEAARKKLDWYFDVFGPDNFFLDGLGYMAHWERQPGDDGDYLVHIANCPYEQASHQDHEICGLDMDET